MEGNEYVTNKRATANNLEALETINRFGDDTKFKVVEMADGGQMDFNATNSMKSSQDITMLAAIMDSYGQSNLKLAQRPVVVQMKDVETGLARVANIREVALS